MLVLISMLARDGGGSVMCVGSGGGLIPERLLVPVFQGLVKVIDFFGIFPVQPVLQSDHSLSELLILLLLILNLLLQSSVVGLGNGQSICYIFVCDVQGLQFLPRLVAI